MRPRVAARPAREACLVSARLSACQERTEQGGPGNLVLCLFLFPVLVVALFLVLVLVLALAKPARRGVGLVEQAGRLRVAELALEVRARVVDVLLHAVALLLELVRLLLVALRRLLVLLHACLRSVAVVLGGRAALCLGTLLELFAQVAGLRRTRLVLTRVVRVLALRRGLALGLLALELVEAQLLCRRILFHAASRRPSISRVAASRL